jgi:hypothetical protein
MNPSSLPDPVHRVESKAINVETSPWDCPRTDRYWIEETFPGNFEFLPLRYAWMLILVSSLIQA